jgi:NAD(P)-dependent dehydrogenase (short-subunit alcohol dehydrogenase family)
VRLRRRPSPVDPRVVVITGASSGVGRATAHAFAERGATVALLARNERGLGEAAREVERLGGTALVCPVDVADAAAVEAAADRVESEAGPIDTWVNAAMATVLAPLDDISAEEFRRATDVTYLGAVHGTMAALRRMQRRNRGTIVQVGSVVAYRGLPFQTPYSGAKAALRGFTESLRTELLHRDSDIHVSEVHLSAINTPHFVVCRSRQQFRTRPVPPIYTPEVAASSVVWAATHRRRELWVGYPAVVAILGGKFFPGLSDRVLGWRGVELQLTRTPVALDRPDNLFEPVPFDPGTAGPYRGRTWGWSAQLWVSAHRRVVGTAVAVAALAGAAGRRRR